MFQENILLTNHSAYKIGGPARYFFETQNVSELIRALDTFRKIQSYETKSRQIAPGKMLILILGEGTNILFSDDGFNGLVLKPHIQILKRDGYSLRVGAGVSMTQLLHYSIIKGLSGLEWAGGLPGTFGGAIYGNAGCFKGEIKDLIKEVVSLDISGPRIKIIKRGNSDCDFRYRSSIFKKRNGKEIILEATLIFKKGDKKSIRSAVEEKIHYRQEKQPLHYPNIGSIFKNVELSKVPRRIRQSFSGVIKTDPFPVVPTAHLIHEAGLKGVSYGGAMISPKHPNFIVNVLNATASDVKALIELAKNKVKKRFGIELEEEVIILA